MVRLAAIAAALTAVTIPLVACSSSDDLDDPTVEQPASSGGVADDAMPTGVAFPVRDPRNGSDGVSDELYDVAAAGDTVVAVGGIDSPRVTQPVVIVSKDGGHTWRPATLEGLDGRSNESVETVSHGAHGWVGIGYDADGVPVSWTSADGVTWTRRGSSGFVLADTVGVVAASDAGFVAGGSFDRGRASVPATWFSPDGRKWQRTAAPGQQESEGAWINGIATFGHRAVAVGSTSDGGMDEGRAWISADGGRTWRTEDIFGTSVYDVTALTHYGQLKGPAFIAVGKQSYIPFPGYRDIPDSGWEPDVDFRVDSNADVRGGPWLGEAISTRPTAGDQELYAAAPLGSGLVVAGVDRRSNSRVDAFVYRDARNGWRRVTGPSLRGPGEQSVNAAAASGSSSVMVGYDERSGDRSAAAWIVRPGGKVIEIRGRQLLDVPPPNPEVYDVATGDDGRLTAVGAVGDHAAAWTSDDGQTWQQVTLPDAAAAAESWATEVTHGRRGWLVVGQDGYLRSRSVAVWRSHDGRSWRRVDELTRPIEYDYNDANGLAFTGRGYVVGGSSSRGGYFDNGAVWWSGDGSRWRATPSVGEDDDHKRTAARHGPAAALFGGIRRDVVIYDVVPRRPAASSPADRSRLQISIGRPYGPARALGRGFAHPCRCPKRAARRTPRTSVCPTAVASWPRAAAQPRPARPIDRCSGTEPAKDGRSRCRRRERVHRPTFTASSESAAVGWLSAPWGAVTDAMLSRGRAPMACPGIVSISTSRSADRATRHCRLRWSSTVGSSPCSARSLRPAI